MNALLKLLGVRLPIIQAPMAGVSTPAMAAAVSNAGGLGSIGVGNLDATSARGMIAAVRGLTDKPFNVNVFCHWPAMTDADVDRAWLSRLASAFERFHAEVPQHLREPYKSFVEDDAMLAMLLEKRPGVVSFHFGLPPADRIRALRQAGITLLATATNVKEARQINAAGIDAVIAQGYEAGGHRGMFEIDVPDDRLGTLALTRLLAREVRIPVIAAGGIMDGAGITAVILLGASAAQLGTAFIDCPESSADANHRAALHSDAAGHTIVTRVISGRPLRCIPNKFTALYGDAADCAVPSYPLAYDAAKSLAVAARAAGESGYSAKLAGQGAPLARAMPAGDLVRLLGREIEHALQRKELMT